MELSDLFYQYPDIKDENIQTILSSKEELKTLSEQAAELTSIPEQGEYYPYQKMVHILLSHYDRLLVTSEPGVGKTGIAAGFAEKLKRDHMSGVKSYVDEYISTSRSHYKRVYVLLKNESLVTQWIREISCKYSVPGDYETDYIKDAPTERALKIRINKEIEKYYTITTYEKFAKRAYELVGNGKRKKLGRMTWSKEYVQEYFSDSLFIVDEVHNLSSDDEELEDDRDIDKVKINKNKKIKLKNQIYDALHFLFHNIDRSKVILISATPMINFTYEIGPIMNLLLPLDNQMPSSPSFYKVQASNPKKGITKSDIKNKQTELGRYFSGYITYIAESKAAVVPKYIGEKINKTYEFHGDTIRSKQIIYKVKMTPTPLKLNGKIVETVVVDGKNVKAYNQLEAYEIAEAAKDKEGAFNAIKRQSANMTFPDGSTGTSGASNYIIEEYKEKYKRDKGKKGGKKNITRYSPRNNLSPWLSSKENLKQLAVKMVECINLIESANGNVFVYTSFKSGSGAFILGMCLENISKYKLFNSDTSIFLEDNETTKSENKVTFNSLCGTNKIKIGNKSVTVKTERRAIGGVYKAGYKHNDGTIEPYKYAIITSGMTEQLISNIISTYNSYENRYGQYIKCIIATPKARESINIFNVIRYINFDPGWNEKFMKQSKYRVFRSGSHKDLIYDLIMNYMKKGITPTEKQLQILVEVINMATVKADGSDTVDTEMYVLSEEKDISISFVEKIMRSHTLDCQLLSDINTKSKKTTGEEYVCADVASNTTRFDSYRNLYAGETISQIKIKIKSIFHNIFSIQIHKLYDALSEYNELLIDYTIYELISEKDFIIDMYGYPRYFKETNNQIYIVPEYPVEVGNSKYISDYYARNRTFIYETNLSDYYNIKQGDSYDDISQQLLSMNPNTDEWENIFFSQTDQTKLRFFEEIIIDYITSSEGRKDEFNIDFYKKFKMYIHFFHKPIDLLKKTIQSLNQRGKGKGPKPDENKIPDIKTLKYIDKNKNKALSLVNELYVPTAKMVDQINVLEEQVIMHTFGQELLKSKATGKNGKSSKFGIYEGNIRILVSKNEIWRDSQLSEILLYNAILNIKEKEKMKEFDKYMFIGIITIYPSDRDKVWIRMINDNTGKKRTKGRDAGTFNIPEKYNFMWYLYKESKRLSDVNPTKYPDYPLLDMFSIYDTIENASIKDKLNKIDKNIKIETITSKVLKGEDAANFSNQKLDYYFLLSNAAYNSDVIQIQLRDAIIKFGNAYYV